MQAEDTSWHLAWCLFHASVVCVQTYLCTHISASAGMCVCTLACMFKAVNGNVSVWVNVFMMSLIKGACCACVGMC